MPTVRALFPLLLAGVTASAQTSPASLTTLGAGTAGSVGVPSLAATSLPAVGHPRPDLRITGGLPGSLALVLLSNQARPAVLPDYGATLWPALPAVALPTLIGPSGTSAPTSTPGILPPALAGTEFVAQGLVADGAALGGLAFTAGLSLVPGPGLPGAGLFPSDPAVLVPLQTEFVAAGDLTGDGRAELIALTRQGLLQVARALPEGGYVPAPPLPGGDDPQDLELGDLDGDGLLDLALTRRAQAGTAPGRLVALVNQGDGQLGAPLEKAVGLDVGELELADVTGDGVLDALSARKNAVVSLAGKGDGDFDPPAASVLPFFSGFSARLAAGDLDGDGQVDLLALSTNRLRSLGGQGDGLFQLVQESGLSASGLRSLELADVDGDGDLDAVYLDGDESTGRVRLLRGLGDGGFGAAELVAELPEDETDLAVADVTGDGQPDLVVGQAPQWSPFDALGFVVLEGLGDGTFLDGELVPVSTAERLVVEDVDSDGDQDVVSLTPGDTLLVTPNPGGGAFVPSLSGGLESAGGLAVDLDQDGRTDVVSLFTDAAGLSSWNPGLADGGFGPSLVLDLGVPFAQTLAFEDVNGDGLGDLVVVGFATGAADLEWRVLLGQGGAQFVDSGQLLLLDVDGLSDLAFGDLDGDGRLDAVVSLAQGFLDAELLVLLGGGDGSFTPGWSQALSGVVSRIRLGDVTGDGLDDVLQIPVVDLLENDLQVWPGQGDGTFAAPLATPIDLPAPLLAQLDDLDGDGHTDAVITSSSFAGSPVNRLMVAYGRGDGSFEDLTEHAVAGRFAFVVTTADLDGNGTRDLVVGQPYAGVVTLLLGSGQRSFGPAQPLATAAFGSPLLVEDRDGDQRVDLVLSSPSSGLVIWTNQGWPVPDGP